MNEKNKMYEYLLEHNYVSKNENKNPLRQQELSKERAECIANKYNNLFKEEQNNWNELKKGLKSLFEFDEGVVSKDYLECAEDTLEKMEELEQGKDE